jgi:hypothetical protein
MTITEIQALNIIKQLFEGLEAQEIERIMAYLRVYEEQRIELDCD